MELIRSLLSRIHIAYVMLILIALVIAIAIGLYFYPLNIKISECKVLDQSYILNTSEYKASTSFARQTGLTLNLRVVNRKKTCQNLVEKTI